MLASFCAYDTRQVEYRNFNTVHSAAPRPDAVSQQRAVLRSSRNPGGQNRVRGMAAEESAVVTAVKNWHLAPRFVSTMKPMHTTASAAVVVAIGVTTLTLAATKPPQPVPAAPTAFTGVLDEHPAIQYADRPTEDRVAALRQTIQSGSAALGFEPQLGFLRAVLDALSIPAESQVLVFSKTGVQRAATSPRTPRAIYFDDSVVVGYIPGARFLELAAHDPQQGVVFYTLDQVATATPALVRRTSCLTCHVSSNTLDVPGMIHRSQMLDGEGEVMPQLGSTGVDHRTPLAERWGGWFVTGNYTKPPYDGTAHQGNVTVSMHPTSGPATRSNEVFIQWLNSAPETRGYLSPDSDIAALMLFDHQMHAVNLMTRLQWEARVAVSEGGRIDPDRGILRDLVDELADYFLFVGEAPPPSRVTPRAGLADRFRAAATRDRQGRSFRDLDLETRLLRYPCSYMIDTAAFERLPGLVRSAVYRRMWEILSGSDAGARYAHLSTADRRAIIEILRDTKTDLPAVYR